MSRDGRIAMADREWLTREDMEALVNDSDHEVRKCVARNPALPADLMSKLVEDSIRDFRIWVARFAKLTLHDVEKLAEDADWYIRLWLASRKDLPVAIQLRLLCDSNVHVRDSMRRNASPEALAMDSI